MIVMPSQQQQAAYFSAGAVQNAVYLY